MKTKRVLAALLATGMFMGIFGGCNSAQTPADPDQPADPASAEATSKGENPANSGEKAKLLYTYWGSAFEKDAQAGAIKSFTEANPDIEVEALHIPSAGGEYMAKLTAMTASGTNPDVGYMDAAASFTWAKEGKFYNIFELIDNDPSWSKDTYVDDIFYMYEEDKSFGTTSSINPRSIFYNTECFTAAGVEVPPTDLAKSWTWDEFVKVAKSLTLDVNGKKPDEEGFDPGRIQQYGIYLNPSDMTVLSIFLDSNGADILSEDGNKLAMDTPESKEVLQAIHDLIYVHHVAPIPNDFSNMPDGPTWLKNKQSAMFISGQWVLLDIAKLEFEYGIGQLPKFKEARNVKDAGVRVIFQNTKYPEAAWELYKYLANPAGAMNLYADGLWMPTLREWYEDESLYKQWGADNAAHPDSYKEVVADSLFNGSATPSWTLRIANFAELNSVISPLLQQVWLDSKDVDGVAAEINEQASGLVQGYNPGNKHNSAY